jgi:hypothetical protein
MARSSSGEVVHNTTVDPPEKITAGDRFLLISGFIVAICITGIRYPSLCDETQAKDPMSNAIIKHVRSIQTVAEKADCGRVF